MRKLSTLSLPLLLAACGGGGMTPTPPSGAGTIAVAISGEEEAVEGIAFKPTPGPEERVFVDGWSIKFDRWITILGGARLNQPGQDPQQQQVIGALVAEKSGPWAVDLTKKELIPLFSFDKDKDGKALDTKTRYAFSYDLVPATATAQKVNLDAGGEAALAEMVKAGASNWVELTATHPGSTMTPFDKYPTTVKFKLWWGGNVSYINCSNPDNGDDEEKNRGVQPKQDGPQRAEIFIHTDHAFWDKLNVEDPPLHFDPIAAWAQKAAGSSDFVVTIDDLSGALVTDLKGRDGAGVPDRGDIPGYTKQTGNLKYDPNGTPGITTLKQFIVYSVQSMAHLNGEGLCYVDRK